jgi:DNA-directed RNA polymerase specialized sigma24 family protein
MLELEPNLREQLFDGIVEKLQTMSSAHKEVFVLRHYQGRTESEIATLLAIEKPEVRRLLREAVHSIYDGIAPLRPPFEPYDD